MKKNDKDELKRILKPLIEQTIRQVLLEEGVLSSVVSEVVKGIGAPVVVESNRQREMNPVSSRMSNHLNEQRSHLEALKSEMAAGRGEMFTPAPQKREPVKINRIPNNVDERTKVLHETGGANLDFLHEAFGESWKRMSED